MKCPGQDTQFWGAGSIFETECPQCGEVVEFFKDDTMRPCRGCGKRLANPRLDFGCASYCQFAEACIGSLPSELLAEKRALIKERVAVEVKRRCGRDFSRIALAASTARHAECIAREVSVADHAALLCAATLSVLEEHQAKEVMQNLGAPKALVLEVLGLLGSDAKGGVSRDILNDASVIAEAEALAKGGMKKGFFDAEVAPKFGLEESKKLAEKVLMGRGQTD